MTKRNMNLPPDIARRFVEDMEAFYAEFNAIKRDEIAARQLHALREHRRPRDPNLRLSEVKQLFARMREYIPSTSCSEPPWMNSRATRSSAAFNAALLKFGS